MDIISGLILSNWQYTGNSLMNSNVIPGIDLILSDKSLYTPSDITTYDHTTRTIVVSGDLYPGYSSVAKINIKQDGVVIYTLKTTSGLASGWNKYHSLL